MLKEWEKTGNGDRKQSPKKFSDFHNGVLFGVAFTSQLLCQWEAQCKEMRWGDLDETFLRNNSRVKGGCAPLRASARLV